MHDIAIGLLAICAGMLLCLRGYLAMRVIITIWGAFAGFLFGAGLVEAITGDGFLRSIVGWVVGLVLGLVFSAFAYLYFEVSVAIGMAAIGFAIGTSVVAALGISWSWVAILVGVALGLLLAVAAIAGDLPTFILTVLTATAGASTTVFGAMLIFGAVDSDDFDTAATTEVLDIDWWWYAAYIALVVVGLVAQLRSAEQLRQTMREQWSTSGGRQLRAG